MRNKLIKLLQDVERRQDDNGRSIKFKEFIEFCDGDFEHTSYSIERPNYNYLLQEINTHEGANTKKIGGDCNYSKNAIVSELRRMQADGLVFIDTQTMLVENLTQPQEYVCTRHTEETQAITLTTRGKNRFRYALHQATENPVTLLLSIVAILISLIGFFI